MRTAKGVWGIPPRTLLTKGYAVKSPPDKERSHNQSPPDKEATAASPPDKGDLGGFQNPTTADVTTPTFNTPSTTPAGLVPATS